MNPKTTSHGHYERDYDGRPRVIDEWSDVDPLLERLRLHHGESRPDIYGSVDAIRCGPDPGVPDEAGGSG